MNSKARNYYDAVRAHGHVIVMSNYVMSNLLRVQSKSALEITGSHSYVTALRKLSLRSDSHTCTFHKPEKLVTSYCLQAANQRRSATMPSCNGKSWVSLLYSLVICTTKLCCSTLQLQSGSLHMQYKDKAGRHTDLTFANWVWWHLGVG